MGKPRATKCVLYHCIIYNVMQLLSSGRSIFVAALESNDSVHVLFYFSDNWDSSEAGVKNCGPDIRCEWQHSNNITLLREMQQDLKRTQNSSLTVALFNIHSLLTKHKVRYPPNCDWQTDLTMMTSEESGTRFHQIQAQSVRYFDGFSSTNPSSTVQRIYKQAYLEKSLDTSDSTSNLSKQGDKMNNFSSLIKGASYVASNCRTTKTTDRETKIVALRQAGLRVDGLGVCSLSSPKENILHNTKNMTNDYIEKKKTIGKYLFNLAFENTVEPGYVTEKVFDALVSGTVPVYLGDTIQLKILLPHPKSAIFVSDFNNDYEILARYLLYLSNNGTAYEEYRNWRRHFIYDDFIKSKPESWNCRICKWAVSFNKTIASKSIERCSSLQLNKTKH